MITEKAIHEIQLDKKTLSAAFIVDFDIEWEKAVGRIKRKVRWVKKNA